MEKKLPTKRKTLVLHKETLRRLNELELKHANGGVPTNDTCTWQPGKCCPQN